MVNVKKQRMKIYVLDNGRMKMDKNLMFANSNQATMDNPNQPNEMHEFPIYTVFIDHPEAKILFDTACNPNAMGDNGRWITVTQKAFPYFADEACHLPNRLEQIGIDPTNATVIVHNDELNGTMQSYARNQKEGAYIWADIDAWIKNDLTWKTMKRDEDYLKLVDGVKVLNFGSGHAWGMIGLEIETEELGTIILASDAIYTKESMEPTLKPPGILYDSVGWTNSVEKIKKLAAEKNAQIWFGHDGEQFAEFRKSTDGYYE